MYYFLNDNMQAQKSGIEHAEIKRLMLFNKNNVAAKIVTRSFALDLHQVLAQANISTANFINLFDFFNNTEQVDYQQVTVNDLKLPDDCSLQKDGHDYVVTQQDKRLMIITTREPEFTDLKNIQYLEPNGKTVKMVWYDTRGFISLEQYFDWDGKIANEQYLGLDGVAHIQKLHLLDRQGNEQNSWRVLNYHGQDYSFNGMAELTRFFYDELNQSDGGHNVFICDRTVELAWSLFHMETKAFKVLHLHNDHVNDPSDMQHSTLNSNYEHALNNLGQWNAVISATPQQTTDMVARFGKKVPEFTIPVGFVANETLNEPHVDWQTRTPQKLVEVARLAPEKQQDQAIKAFEKVHQHYPKATLEFWGYSNGDTEEKLRQQVTEAGLTDSVKFMGYSENVSEIYNSAQIGLLPSRAEGFSLMLLEAQAHGLPLIANDIKYGPADIIQDQKTGILTKNDDIDGLAEAILDLLSNPAKLMNFSEAAYDNSRRYSEDAVMAQWQLLITEADRFYQQQQTVAEVD
ncbi:accessory Sec system glycosyltransferase Asp1 [Loigolactobacillus iwatensis]|uniref:accessory Sec system glycosyltransferase Asp1 n=1 Tax=Loigolactobacillus iwatensis TaxID=1267156 RepID=UPI000F7EBC6D|nr:accessory Sec system glycosyltransferase Asp1 [Loigolactobacillus iwatensis]